jgi:hypothetical protein
MRREMKTAGRIKTRLLTAPLVVRPCARAHLRAASYLRAVSGGEVRGAPRVRPLVGPQPMASRNTRFTAALRSLPQLPQMCAPG